MLDYGLIPVPLPMPDTFTNSIVRFTIKITMATLNALSNTTQKVRRASSKLNAGLTSTPSAGTGQLAPSTRGAIQFSGYVSDGASSSSLLNSADWSSLGCWLRLMEDRDTYILDNGAIRNASTTLATNNRKMLRLNFMINTTLGTMIEVFTQAVERTNVEIYNELWHLTA